MPRWDHYLRIKEEWQAAQDDKISHQQLAKVIADRLEKIDFNDEDANFQRDELVDMFRGIQDDEGAEISLFDSIMSDLYDFADEVRLWVETF